MKWPTKKTLVITQSMYTYRLRRLWKALILFFNSSLEKPPQAGRAYKMRENGVCDNWQLLMKHSLIPCAENGQKFVLALNVCFACGTRYSVTEEIATAVVW